MEDRGRAGKLETGAAVGREASSAPVVAFLGVQQLTWLSSCLFQGLAYVEYENESQASQAVMKMDGMTIRENVIKVAISNPPQRKAPEKPEARKAPGGSLVPRQIYGA